MGVCLCVTVCLVLHVHVGVEPLIKTPMGQKKCPYCNTFRVGKVFCFDHARPLIPVVYFC